MTARQLLRDLQAAGCDPQVDGTDLVLAADHPPALADAVRVLHTGIRAVLTGRDWLGLPPDGKVVTLSPDARVPADVRHLGVMGEPDWDRVTAAARQNHPELFAAAPAARRAG